MEIVLTHNNMDFDSLAAQFAVTKLHPGTRILPGYPLVGNVREFLALYRDTLPLSQFKYLDLKRIKHAYIVDCQHIERLDETARKLLSDKEHKLTYTLFDHHEVDPNGLGPGARADSIVKHVGSTTTILVDEIRKKKIKLSPFEATLLAIGIYEDTGCLTYRGTTHLDATSLAYLLKEGAELSRINDYLHPKLTDEQTKLLEVLIANARSINVEGTKLVIASASMPTYLEGLATLTRKLVEVESADAAIVVARMRDRIHLVGRSDSPVVDVRALLRHFGGDGHAGAASAVTRDIDIGEIIEKLETLARQNARPEKTAAEIMESPVRTIPPRTSMEEAGRIMLRYGLDGLIVTEGEHVVGVVSRRDIDQAMHHKLGHAPVQGFMSRPVLTISPSTTLSHVEHLMIKEDIGRLPVLDDKDCLIGIVTRREVLSTRYGSDGVAQDLGEANEPHTHQAHFLEKMETLEEPTKWLFREIGFVSAQLNMVAYTVGGCVRDMSLGKPNFDLDFVVEGSAIELAKALEAKFPARLKVVAKHERFQTATLTFTADRKLEVDLSTARTEFYEFPAALPTVEASGLRQDLFRRDFSINAMAICLNPGRYGELIDYFGGLKDLEEKVVRVLHPFSFIEDPTRIVRAARFASRFGFHMDARTREQAERAISMGIFDDLGGVRMRTELRLILESPERLKALGLLGELGGRLRYLDSELTYGPKEQQLLRRAERLLEHYKVEREWVIYLGLLVSQLHAERLRAVLERLQFATDDIDYVEKGIALTKRSWSANLKNSEIFALLKDHADASLAIAACLAPTGTPLRRMIKLYLDELKDKSVLLSGNELIQMGFGQGPELGEILSAVHESKLDGKIASLDDEKKFVMENFGQGRQTSKSLGS